MKTANFSVKDRKREGAELESEIVSTLRSATSDLSLPDLLSQLSQRGIANEEIAKGEITRLLAENKLVLTPQRNLHLRKNGRQHCGIEPR